MTRNPDKWIRKAVKAKLTGQVVYDMRVPSTTIPEKYIIMSTQTKVQDDQFNKCNDRWDCTILLDIVSRVIGTGNTGDRVPVNDMEEVVIENVKDLLVDGFKVHRLQLESSTSLDNITDTENVFRQLVRYRLWLIET